jgi:hypothetical protein
MNIAPMNLNLQIEFLAPDPDDMKINFFEIEGRVREGHA